VLDWPAWFLRGAFAAETAADGQEALDKLASNQVHVLVTDLMMPRMDGFELLKRLGGQGSMPPAIVLTAFGNIETAVQTMHDLGAFWFLEKPIQPSALRLLLERAASQSRLTEETERLQRQLTYAGVLVDLVGGSPQMQQVFSLIRQVAPSKAAVLMAGESGTGKELVARAIHHLSPRRGGPFVAINCAAMPETLMESELFGHEKGAFTGAVERRAGCFELAQHGTLLLDESAKCRWPHKPNCSAFSRTRASGGSVAKTKSPLTCVSSRRQTAASKKPSQKANFAKICTTA
jgi:DNA-binding NtrC family response regulator